MDKHTKPLCSQCGEVMEGCFNQELQITNAWLCKCGHQEKAIGRERKFKPEHFEVEEIIL
ncbi:MAG: hypothetical protein ACRBCS_03090 [Cellvibrionaceae bacterium]